MVSPRSPGHEVAPGVRDSARRGPGRGVAEGVVSLPLEGAANIDRLRVAGRVRLPAVAGQSDDPATREGCQVEGLGKIDPTSIGGFQHQGELEAASSDLLQDEGVGLPGRNPEGQVAGLGPLDAGAREIGGLDAPGGHEGPLHPSSEVHGATIAAMHPQAGNLFRQGAADASAQALQLGRHRRYVFQLLRIAVQKVQKLVVEDRGPDAVVEDVLQPIPDPQGDAVVGLRSVAPGGVRDRGRLAVDERHERDAVDVGRDGQAGQFQDRRHDVDRPHLLGVHGSCTRVSGCGNDQRDEEILLPEVEVALETVLSQHLSVIRSQDEDRPVLEAGRPQPLEEPPELSVGVGDAAIVEGLRQLFPRAGQGDCLPLCVFEPEDEPPSVAIGDFRWNEDVHQAVRLRSQLGELTEAGLPGVVGGVHLVGVEEENHGRSRCWAIQSRARSIPDSISPSRKCLAK